MAQRIPQEVIEEIRQRTNIVDVIGQYVQLKKSGKNYMGLCPFHEERSPSFSVAEDKQIFHCFGCGKGGTVFNFVQEIEGISFPESVRKVSELENISVSLDWSSSIEASDNPENKRHRQLLEAHKKAAELYHHILINTKLGEPALSYLNERGLTRDLIETFQIGFAPQKRDFLLQVFKNDEQFSEEILSESGLFTERENGEFLDRFYQRIMFPINNEQGKIIAFSGRLLKTETFSGEDMPKYLNSPETTLFNKRDTLFNFDRAKKVVRKEATVFLFEGFMDVIAAWQAGIPNGVASMGTSLTNEQIRRLERVAKELVICYDGDSAGVEATNRAIHLLSQHSRFQLSIVSIPEKMDPDDYLQKYGAEAFRELAIHGRITPFTFRMNYHRLSRNMNNEKEQLDYVNELLHELTMVHSPLERDRYMNQIAQEFQLSLQSLEDQLKQIRQEERNQQRSERQSSAVTETYQEAAAEEWNQPMVSVQNKLPLSQVERAEQALLYRLMNEQGVRNLLAQQVDFHFAHLQYQEFYLLLDSYLSTHATFLFADFLDFLQDQELKRLAIEISYLKMSEESSERELADILHLIKHAGIDEEIEEKLRMRNEALRVKNSTLANELSIQLLELRKQKELSKNRS